MSKAHIYDESTAPEHIQGGMGQEPRKTLCGLDTSPVYAYSAEMVKHNIESGGYDGHICKKCKAKMK